ncbi:MULTISPECIES: hypothetical protein [unclassified Streptomyces]|nr:MULTISPECIES: hypothetical protein [unclassified Streptomyces]MYT28279.1 hypothetical protein [Streptomyces sp. SID8354]
MSRSTDGGATWSAPVSVTRVPVDATTSGVDHATSGSTAKIGLYYYLS